MKKISVIVAMTNSGVIGKEGKIPWRIRTDMDHFVRLTTGHPVIMGRKTYESIDPKYRPLKNRTNIVVTRDPSKIVFETSGIIIVSSPKEALSRALDLDEKEVFIAGGTEIYRELVPFANRLFITLVDANVEGDKYFPYFPLVRLPGRWNFGHRGPTPKTVRGPKDQYPCSFSTIYRLPD